MIWGNDTKLVQQKTYEVGGGLLTTVTPGVALIKASLDEEQLVFGEVYAPGFPDSQGDFMTAAEIKRMAYGFMSKSDMHEIDIQHNQEKSGSYIVESFIARDDDPLYIPGSWVIGVHIPSRDTWSLVKSGEINGFSLDGIGIRTPANLAIDLPEILQGRTTKADDEHEHDYWVRFDDQGRFLGGRTSPLNGHFHEILRGTCTEEAGSPAHSHRFSFVEGILNA